ncbi:MAG TPA: N-acetyltransferase [Rhizomicrobium sp.]|nr:N-acetyltransferase [Rhizomicrobium sp.]
MTGTWQIRPERPEDADAVEALDNDGFGPGRYAKSAYRLREGVAPEASLSFVAVENGKALGSIRFWPVKIGGENALLLGPLAVKSELRGQGIGIALMQHGIERARAQGYGAIILVGDEAYYRRVGFARIANVRMPGPVNTARILGLALKPDALANLSGDITRVRIDVPVCADGARLG